jgi:hypothetical protein
MRYEKQESREIGLIFVNLRRTLNFYEQVAAVVFVGFSFLPDGSARWGF